MNSPWKLLSFILFPLTEINVVQSSSTNSSKYDLTDVLNDAIVRLLKSNDIVEKSESLITEPETDRKYDNGGYHRCRINNTGKILPLRNTIDVFPVNVYGGIANRIELEYNQHNSIRWEFHENKLRMFYNELDYIIFGCVDLKKSDSYWDFNTESSQIRVFRHRYENLSVIATKPLVKQKGDGNITIDISCDHSTNSKGIEFEKSRKIPYKNQLKLLYLFSLELPSITRHVFNHGDKLRTLLDQMFNRHPKQHVITSFPDFLANEQRYYYLIPDISYGYLSLKNIIIRGLTNFESYVNNRIHDYPRTPFYTLHVANVTGNITLDAAFDHLPRFQLSFSISNLYISYEPKKDKFSVEARNYTFVEDALEPPTLISSWLLKYLTSIKKVIELSMEDLLAPPKKDTEKSISSTPHLSELGTSFMEFLKKSAI